MDPDLNKYDLNHRVTHHPRMSDAEWEEAFWGAHRSFYSFKHMDWVFRRMVALDSGMRFTTLYQLMCYRLGPVFEQVAFSEFGVGRIRRRKQRRPGLKRENPLIFYPRVALRHAAALCVYGYTYARLRFYLKRALRKCANGRYVDDSIRPLGTDRLALARLTADRTTERARRRIAARSQAPA